MKEDPEKLAELRSKCDAANAVDRATIKTRSRWGPSSREVQGVLGQQRQEARMNTIRHERGGVSKNDAEMVSSSVKAAFESAVDPSVATLSALVSTVRRELRLQRKVGQEIIVADKVAVARYKEKVATEERPQIIQAALGDFPTIGAEQLQPTPASGASYEVTIDIARSYNIAHRIAEATAQRSSNLDSALQFDLMSKLRPILDYKCAPLVTEAPKKVASKPPDCDYETYCFCKGDSVLQWKMRCRFYGTFKDLLKLDDEYRDLLDEKKIYMLLRGVREQVNGLQRDLFEELGKPVDKLDVALWWHVGSHCYSPYFSTFRVLQPCDTVHRFNASQVGLMAHPIL